MSDTTTTASTKKTPPVINKGIRKSEVGEVRPSQSLTTFGIGSLIDLPNLSVLVMGLEDWPIARSEEIGEERLLVSVQRILGGQVQKLLTPPRGPESFGAQTNRFDESRTIGIPVAPFPRWLVCSDCRLLAPISSGLFEAKVDPYRPDKTRFIHNCTTNRRSPVALPARFMVACNKGHLDDFPWLDFAHRGKAGCNGPLELYEVGASGEASDVEVHCRACNAHRRMAEAFGKDNEQNMPECKGRRPHLRDHDPHGCDVAHVRPILQGASNSWFTITVSALSVPQATDKLAQLVDDNWTVLEKATNPEIIAAFRAIGQLKDFAKYNDVEVWDAVEKKRTGSGPDKQESADLKSPEWAVFSDPGTAQESKDFRLRSVEPPEGYESYFERIVLVEKLREVKALVGFTRIESPRDFDSPQELPKEKRAPLSRQQPTWVPACETRGEGIFFQFSEKAIQKWLARTTKIGAEFQSAHERWRATRNLDPAIGFPGMRYVLLHSFSHAIIRQLSIECGYTTASVGERIYHQDGADGEPMAGVLIYTAAADSEGTLGGLCALGETKKLGRHLDQALERVSLCASDPLFSLSICRTWTRVCTVPPAMPVHSYLKPRANEATNISTALCLLPQWNDPISDSLNEWMGTDLETISRAAARLAAELPLATALIAARHIESSTNLSIAADRMVELPHPHYRQYVAWFLEECRQIAPPLSSQAVAIALLTAAHCEQAHRDEQSVELVWTGPDAEAVPFRRTAQAILQVLDSAQERITLVSYAVYRIPHVCEALVRAARRGVHINVIVETPDRIEGQGEYSTIRALGSEVASCAAVYFWPQENRRRSEAGKVGILHVKCVVADGRWLFLSSANFTEQAFDINMELGMLVTGGILPEQVEANFDQLIATGVLVRL